MSRKILVLMAALSLLVAFTSCKKKEQAPIPGSSPHGQMQQQQPGIMMPQGQSQIVVPDQIKGKWSAVKLAIEDKASGKVQEVAVKLGGEHTIAGSSIKIKVNEFLPDFIMEGLNITSKSDDLNNPAVNVIITEGTNELFKGWLYSKFPAIHPFQHDKFGVTLKEAQRAG